MSSSPGKAYPDEQTRPYIYFLFKSQDRWSGSSRMDRRHVVACRRWFPLPLGEGFEPWRARTWSGGA